MSFHWNLSSEDELEGEDEEEEELKQVAPPNVAAAASLPPPAGTSQQRVESSDDDDDIEWEDADDGELLPVEEDAKLPAMPAQLRPVTLEMSKEKKQDKGDSKKRKRKRRNVYRNAKLPPDLRKLLLNLHKSHLVALTCRAVLISKCCSDENLLALSYSLVSDHPDAKQLPSLTQLRNFCTWYFPLVNGLDKRRRAKLRANVAGGVPRNRQSKKATTPMTTENGSITPESLLALCANLSTSNDENPQLRDDNNHTLTSHDKIQLFISMARSCGWRARYVVALDPMKQDLDMEHPLLVQTRNIFGLGAQDNLRMAPVDPPSATTVLAWVEILTEKQKWIHVDIDQEWLHEPRQVETLYYSRRMGVASSKRRLTIVHALAVEHLMTGDKDEQFMLVRLTDVTPRYANSWTKSKALRGDCHSWFGEMIHNLNDDNCRKQSTSSGTSKDEAIAIIDSDDDRKPAAVVDDAESAEQAELTESAAQETMPTSKAAFKSHGSFVLASQLTSTQVLAPDAKKRICGMFKGELVYRRADMSVARTKKRWLYEGRKVKKNETPIKRVKARQKPASNKFCQLKSYGIGSANDGSEEFRQSQIDIATTTPDDGMQDLFAEWQTDAWSPSHVGPSDEIPVNEYKNIELALLNPGLVHLDRPRMAQVAKNLGIPYAPCLLGFEQGKDGGNRAPTIRGIVVHEHSVELLNEAFTEFQHYSLEQEQEERTKRVRKRWRKIIKGVLIKDRLQREYGGDEVG